MFDKIAAGGRAGGCQAVKGRRPNLLINIVAPGGHPVEENPFNGAPPYPNSPWKPLRSGDFYLFEA